MPESSKKVDSSPAVVAPRRPTKSLKTDDIARLVSVKKQKTVDDTCGGVAQPPVDKNNFDTKKQKNREENKDEEPKKPVATTKNVGSEPPRQKENYDGHPRPLIPPLPCGSKLVYMGNLSLSIQESDVREFFKDVGKVDWVKFLGEGDSNGYGHVRFETYEAGRKALERSGEKLIDRPVELIASEERSIYDTFTPSSEHKYLFMGNLNPDIKEEDIAEFFKDAGDVVSVHLISEDGHFLGHAHVEFASSTVAHKAVRCNMKMLLGHYVELVLATEETVWYSFTRSSKKPRGYGVRRWPGHGPTLGPFCCKCRCPRYRTGRGRGSCHM